MGRLRFMMSLLESLTKLVFGGRQVYLRPVTRNLRISTLSNSDSGDMSERVTGKLGRE